MAMYNGSQLVVRRDRTVLYDGTEIGRVFPDPADTRAQPRDWKYQHISGATLKDLHPDWTWPRTSQTAMTKQDAARDLASLHEKIRATPTRDGISFLLAEARSPREGFTVTVLRPGVVAVSYSAAAGKQGETASRHAGIITAAGYSAKTGEDGSLIVTSGDAGSEAPEGRPSREKAPETAVSTYEKFKVRFDGGTEVNGFKTEAEAQAYLDAGTRPGTITPETFTVQVPPGPEHLVTAGIAEKDKRGMAASVLESGPGARVTWFADDDSWGTVDGIDCGTVLVRWDSGHEQRVSPEAVRLRLPAPPAAGTGGENAGTEPPEAQAAAADGEPPALVVEGKHATITGVRYDWSERCQNPECRNVTEVSAGDGTVAIGLTGSKNRIRWYQLEDAPPRPEFPGECPHCGTRDPGFDSPYRDHRDPVSAHHLIADLYDQGFRELREAFPADAEIADKNRERADYRVRVMTRTAHQQRRQGRHP